MSGQGGQRVKWRCGAIQCNRHEHMGTTWVADAKLKTDGNDDYHIATKLGLCVDPKPLGTHFYHYAMVAFDDEPGALRCMSWNDLEVIYPKKETP